MRRGVQRNAQIFGTEYENPILPGRQNRNAPCAVCLANSRQTVMMVPGRTDCPRRWKREYFGFLMTAHRLHHRTEFVCVDRIQMPLPGTSRNTNGALFYHVEPVCQKGGIPCPPFSAAAELSCVVCSI